MLTDEISTGQKQTSPDNSCCRQLSPVAQPPEHWSRSLDLLCRQAAFLPSTFLVTVKHCFKSQLQRRTGLLFRQQGQILPQSGFFTAWDTPAQMHFYFRCQLRTEPALQIIR